MYDWLTKQQIKIPEATYEIEEFTARNWKNPYALTRKYSLFTQFICMAAYDQQQCTVLYLSINSKVSSELIEEVLLHFRNVKILYYGNKPFQIMLQNVRPSSIKTILKDELHPIVADLFGRQARKIDEEWYPQKGVFLVQRGQLEPFKSKQFDEVMNKLRMYKLTSFETNFLLNDNYRKSNALRYLTYETEILKLTVNENNHITCITFE